jgi:hypothetical protein
VNVDEFVVVGVPVPFKKIVYPEALPSPCDHDTVNVVPKDPPIVVPDVIEGGVKQ